MLGLVVGLGYLNLRGCVQALPTARRGGVMGCRCLEEYVRARPTARGRSDGV